MKQVIAIFVLLLGAPASFMAGAHDSRNDSATKPPTMSFIDARDIGVDCTYSRDSAPALNSLTDNERGFGGALTGATLRFPPGCLVKLGSTWIIKNQSTFTIQGPSLGKFVYAGTAVISYCGRTTSNPVVDMEYVDGFSVQGIAVWSQGVGASCSGYARVGINLDKTGPNGFVNTTKGLFDNVTVKASNGQPGNWKALSLSAVSGANVEDVTIQNSHFGCATSKDSIGIYIGPSNNAKNEQILYNDFEYESCTYSIYQAAGSSIIHGNEIGSPLGGCAVYLGSWSDPNEAVTDNLDESSGQFLCIGSAPTQPLEVSGNNIPLNAVCAIDTRNASVFARVPNQFYPSHGTGPALCNTGHSTPTIIGQIGIFPISQSPLGVGMIGTALPASFLTSGGGQAQVISPGLWNYGSYMEQSTGARFIDKMTFYPGISAGQSIGFGLGSRQAALPCTTNSLCDNEGSLEVTGVTSPGLSGACMVTGADKGVQHLYQLSALDSSGNETLLAPVNYISCNGPAVYDASHYETITWVASPNAATYNLYAVHDSMHISLVAMGITGTSYQFNGPFPVSFPITTVKSPYNKTLAYLLRGKEIDFQYGTPLKGFNDRGMTEEWRIDSTTGNSSFRQVVSTVRTGTPPLKVISTTPVANLTTAPVTFNAAGVQQIGAHVVEDVGVLEPSSPSTATITLSGAAAFTSSTSYNCAVTNKTTAGDPLKIGYINGGTFVVIGPNAATDDFSFVCIGN